MNKPEIDASGNKRWKNAQGQYHREDGPAIEYADGSKCWYLNGQYLMKEQWEQQTAKQPVCENKPNIEQEITYITSQKIDDALRAGRQRDLKAYSINSKKMQLDPKKVAIGILMLVASVGSFIYLII